MRILQLPRRFGDAIDNVNVGMLELRRGVLTLLLPLKILMWTCVVVVAYECAIGVPYANAPSMARRTMASAIDQFWYVVFYLTFPGIWQICLHSYEQFRRRREWTLVDQSHANMRIPSNQNKVCACDVVENDWVIVEYQ